MANRLNLKYNGLSHNCLQYAMAFRTKPFFTARDVMVIFGHKTKNNISKFNESLEILAKNGMLTRVESGYRITIQGKDYLRFMAHKRKAVSDND